MLMHNGEVRSICLFIAKTTELISAEFGAEESTLRDVWKI
jgi:hypothetical protein